jgi:hypothetical protein
MKKDWQRLPTQLLHEWTQREKRPKAQFHRVKARQGGGKGGGKGKGGKGKGGKGEGGGGNHGNDADDGGGGGGLEDWKRYHPDFKQEFAHEADDDREETEWRERVVLGDPKHPDRSLAFCPSEPSPTRELAREHAALLALLQVVVMVVVVVVVVVLEDL